MKSPIICLIVFTFLFSCKKNTATNEKTTEVVKTASLEGTWEMIGLYNYRNNQIVDSFKTREGNRQVKMYTKSKVMWSKLVPADSTEYFAYGAYTLSDSILNESLDYGSKTMNLVIGKRKDYRYKIVLEDDKFSQIEIDDDGNRIYSENYRRVD